MEPKGSRKNPYTWNEYTSKLQNQNWQGGWVKNGGAITYYSQTMATYSNRCEKSYPIPYDYYWEMAQQCIWLGGWVRISPNVMKYIDANGTEYESTLGYQSNPCPLSIYNEMAANGIWEGGWIIESNGTIRYVQVFILTLNLNSGSGCGCGGSSSGSSGSGSGSGSGSSGSGSGSGSGGTNPPITNYAHVFHGSCKAGDVYVCIGIHAFREELHISWTDGNTIESALSIITTSVHMTDSSISIISNDICASWSGPYQMSVRGSFTIKCQQDHYRFSLNEGTFIVPEEYRY